MNRLGKSVLPAVLAAPTLLLALSLAGCHSNNPNQAQNQDQPPASDPASANLAPASNVTETAAENPPPPPPDQQNAQPGTTAQALESEYPGAQNQSDQSDQYAQPDQSGDYSSPYEETDEAVAPQPPPALPDYDQPPAPGDDYLWTPGYWAYAPDGYYWVPGAWVMAPWVGALWTPGYWGFYGSSYHWYPGYWGSHIGFYGGVNYGHGYDGDGYEGGYWHQDHFYYNRDVSHVGNDIHRTYDYRVQNHFNTSRVSYNGGRDGLNYRPSSSQIAARSERHYAPLTAQVQLARTAQQNRAQFATQNHGRPQNFAESRPINSGRTAPGPRPQELRTAPTQRSEPNRPQAEHTTPREYPSGQAIRKPQTPLERNGGVHPEAHPQPQQQSQQQRGRETRPEQQPRQENRPQQEKRPQPAERPQARPEPQQRREPQERQQPQQRQEQPRQEQQPRAEQHPAQQPRSRPEQRPQPHQEQKPQPHNDEHPH